MGRGGSVAKEKKSKKDKKPAKKKNAKIGKVLKAAKPAATLKTIASHPLVADVVAAALVATASALKDPKRARALASEAADDVLKLSKAGSERGNALWEMALQIGKRSLESLAAPPEKGSSTKKAVPEQASFRKPKAKKP